MSGLDVEALLDLTATSKEEKASDRATSPREDGDRSDRHARDGNRERAKDGSRDRERRRRDRSGTRHRSSSENRAGTPHSEAGSYRSRRRSRSRDRDEGRRSRRQGRDGDYYRGNRRGGRSRSRSPDHSRHYRPRDERDRGDRSYRRREDDRTSRRGSASRDDTPAKATEDERDRKTVFVQQLSARLRTRELKEFFEKAGPVADAQIVKDRVSNRSKGVGYVEFEKEESVQAALQLTGHTLLGIPVIVQLTEAEKNRQVRTEPAAAHPNQVPFHRLYVGNIHFSITEEDLRAVFQPFGALEFVTLQKDDNGRSRGYGFVQFVDAQEAKNALEQMNGFELAGRPIRVGLGNDRFTPETTANLMHRFQGPGAQQNQAQGSAFSGAGGRGHQASNFDRAGGRDGDKGAGASALDDTDVAGVNFNNYSRDALMRKLARTDEPATSNKPPVLKPKTEVKPLPVNVAQASRCIVLKNMFDPAEEEGEDWVKELEDDVRTEAEEKYGHVIHVAVDPNSNGEIYLKFDKIQGGENAIKGLNGRYFGGRMITAQPVVDAVYSSLFSRAKAI